MSLTVRVLGLELFSFVWTFGTTTEAEPEPEHVSELGASVMSVGYAPMVSIVPTSAERGYGE